MNDRPSDTTVPMKLSDYPVTQWQPHKRETWPWRIGKLRQPTRLRIWNGHGADPEFTERWLPAGAKVKIVMVSRFGDVGITDDLSAEHGYHSRVDLEMLEPVNV